MLNKSDWNNNLLLLSILSVFVSADDYRATIGKGLCLLLLPQVKSKSLGKRKGSQFNVYFLV